MQLRLMGMALFLQVGLIVWPHGGARGKVRWSQKWLGYVIWAPWISIPNLVPIHLMIIEIVADIYIFCKRKPIQTGGAWRKVRGCVIIRIYPQRIYNICCKFHGYFPAAVKMFHKPQMSSSYWHQRNNRRSPKSVGFIIQNCMLKISWQPIQ